MALSVKVGTFSARTTTGNSAITGVGFQPKALLLTVTNRISNGVSGSIMQFGWGMSSSTVSRSFAMTTRNGSTTAVMVNAENAMGTSAIQMLNTFGILSMEANVVSFDADGFTLNFTTVDTSAWLIGYMALGGSDIDVFVGDFSLSTSTGNQDITGLGFSPHAVMFAHTNQSSTIPYVNRTNSVFGFGVGVDSSNRFGSVVSDRDQVLPTESARYQRNDRCLVGLTAANAIDFEADYSGSIANGFRINILDAPATAVKVGYLAIAGATFSTGLETQRTSAGTKATTVDGTPKGALFFGSMKTAGTTVDTSGDFAWSMGFDDATTKFATIGRVADNVNTTDTLSAASTVRSLGYYDLIAGTVTSEVTTVTYSADTMTLNWNIADATAREFGYLALTEGAPSNLYSLTPSDTGVTNSESLSLKPIYPVTDTGLTFAESLVLRPNRTFSESGVSLSESIVIRPNILVSDTGVSQNDSVVLQGSFFLTPTENGATITDSSIELEFLSRPVSDTGVTNSESIRLRPTLGVVDTGVTNTDSLSLVPIVAVTVSDTGTTVSENVAIRLNYIVPDSGVDQNDSLSIRPSIFIADTGLSITESIRLTFPIAVVDSGTVNTDSVGITYNSIISVVDNGSNITESVVRTLLEGISDNITIVESIVGGNSTATTSSDSIGLSEIAFSGSVLSVFDTVGISEGIVGGLQTTNSSSDTTTINETLGLLYSSNSSASDTIAISDQIVIELPAVGLATDTLGIVDDIISLVQVTPAVADSIGIDETSTSIRTGLGFAIDTVGISDTITAIVLEYGFATDIVGVNETTLANASFISNLNDSINVQENSVGSLSTRTTTQDTVGVSDQADGGFINNMSANDIVGISENVTRLRQARVSISDTVGISEDALASRGLDSFNENEDTLTIGDSASGIRGYNGNSIDSISISELINKFTSVDPGDDLGRILSDNVAVGEFAEAFLGARVVLGFINEDDIETQL